MGGGGTRAFIAVSLPEPMRADLLAVAQGLGRDVPGVRAAAKIENFHLTIKFLGRIPDARIDDLGGALATAVAAVPAFAVQARGLGAFASPRNARVLWAGVADPTGGLGRLAGTVDAVVRGLALGNLDEAARGFHPHITLGRAKPKTGVDARAWLAGGIERDFGAIAVDEVHVYESRLGRAGSTYVLRARATLAGGSAAP